MNYKEVNCWLCEHDIILEQGFVDAFKEYAQEVKKNMA